MGTNFYLRMDVCKHCGSERARVHVGKSSVGWAFLFRGYRAWPLDDVPHPITSAEEWRRVMKVAIENGALLTDEYGRDVDVNEFWTLAENKREEKGDNSYQHGSRRSEWYDGDGNRFCDSEFT